ncbi:MAG: ABC transporter substrate-binding protein [Bradyrhizobium sp.]
MRRREFLTAIGAAAAWPGGVLAQDTGRVFRLGVLIPASRESIEPFFDELRLSGFVEGQNLAVNGYYNVPGPQNVGQIAALIKTSPDVILCGPEIYARALAAATTRIPLVSMSEDLVGEGLAASLARPGGNVTGISLLSPELDGKRQEILIEAVPGVRRMAALAHSAISIKKHFEEQQELARARGIELSVHPYATGDEIGPALDRAKASGAQAINFLATPQQIISRAIILNHMSRIRLPAIYQWPETPQYGGLMGYGPPFAEVYRQRARQIAKIFRGAAVAEVPIEQPARFELAINLKTAREIALDIPAGLLLRADRVIE